jgi:Family of unknown function (DUF6527)
MSSRAQKVSFHGIVEHRHEADERLRALGDAVLVRRGVDRSLTMLCPDGCGETLTVNLDRRTGPAWRFYAEGQAVSLFPSVWRNTGCCSHFVVWKSRIYWCDWGDELLPVDEEFEERVLATLTKELRLYTEVAERLDAVPWAVLSACSRLCRKGLALAGKGEQQVWFRQASR